MNKICFLDISYKLLERLEESIVKRMAHKSNDQFFTSDEAHLVESFLKAVYCDGISEGVKSVKKEGISMD